MIIDQTKNRLNNGFHPFTLELSNGKKFRVPHERTSFTLHPKVVVVIDQKGISHTINPLHIVSLDEAAHKE